MLTIYIFNNKIYICTFHIMVNEIIAAVED